MLSPFLSTEFLCEDHKKSKIEAMEERRGFYFVVNALEQKAVLSKSHRAQNSTLPRCKMRDYDGMRPTTQYLHYMENSVTTLPIRPSKLQHLSTCTLVFSDGYYRAKCL